MALAAFGLAPGLGKLWAESREPAEPMGLFSVRDVRELSRTNALRGLPVELRGIVLLWDPGHSNLYVRDLTGSTRVRGVSGTFETGEYVEVVGITTAGYAPEVAARSLKKLGHAPVGRGASISFPQLRTGTNESQWVRWERGIITESSPRPWGHELRMALGEDMLNLWVITRPGEVTPTNLVHSRASVQCVVEITENPGNRYMGSRFLVPGWHYLNLEPLDPEIATNQPIATAREIASQLHSRTQGDSDAAADEVTSDRLMQFRAGPGPIRASGVVLFQPRPTRVYCLDETGPLRVDLVSSNSFSPGDRVEIVGYPQVFERRTWIRDSVMTRKSGGEIPPARSMTVSEVLDQHWDARRVTMSGVVERHEIWPQNPTLRETCTVRDRSQRGSFQLRVPAGTRIDRRFPIGAEIQVTGLSVMDGPLSGGGYLVNVYAGTADDVRILRPPPFWNSNRVVAVLVLLGVAMLVVAARALAQRRELEGMRKSGERLRTLLENSFDATFVLGADGLIGYMSPAGARILDRPDVSKGVPLQFFDSVHPGDLDRFKRVLDYVSPVPGRTARIDDLRLVGQGGATRWVEAIVTMSFHLRVVEGLVVNIHDVTERKQAFDRLERSMLWQRRLNQFATSVASLHHEDDILWEITRQCVSVLGFVDCIVYRVDPLRKVLVQCAAYGPKNPRAKEILQPFELPVGVGVVGAVAESGEPELVSDTRQDPRYVVDDVVRLSELAVPIVNEGEVLGVIDSEHPDVGFFNQDHLVFLTSVASLCANKLIRARAERRLRQLNSELERRIADRTEELVSANQLLRTNAERLKQAEEELLKALAQERELSQLKTRFVSMVSHELRTPLGVVMCSADILSNYFDELSETERGEHLTAIHESTARMADLMEEVLLLGRADSGRIVLSIELLDLLAICRRTADQVRAASGSKSVIVIQVSRDATAAHGDENLIVHILNNLLSNAIKYSPPRSEIVLGVRREGGNAVISVMDQGIGIREQDRQHLFHAFYRGSNTGNTPGSGLGLVITKRCCELHGGTIEFRSVENIGSTFEVRLPLFQRRATPRIAHESNTSH